MRDTWARRSGRVVAAMLIALVLGAVDAAADSLAGRIVDPQGLPVPNARVKLLDRNSGAQ